MNTLKTCFFDSAGISSNPAVTTLPSFLFEYSLHVDVCDCIFKERYRNKPNVYPVTVRVFDLHVCHHFRINPPQCHSGK